MTKKFGEKYQEVLNTSKREFVVLDSSDRKSKSKKNSKEQHKSTI